MATQSGAKDQFYITIYCIAFNRAPSPTRWRYQSQALVVAFINNYIFFSKEMKALAFNQDRCCHLAFYLQLILFHSICVAQRDQGCLNNFAEKI